MQVLAANILMRISIGNIVCECFLPGVGLGIFTDRDQRGIFLGFEFRKSVFFWVLVIGAVFFWVVK